MVTENLSYVTLTALFSIVFMLFTAGSEAFYKENKDAEKRNFDVAQYNGIIVKIRPNVDEELSYDLNYLPIQWRSKKLAEDFKKSLKIRKLKVVKSIERMTREKSNSRKIELLKAYGFDRLRLITFAPTVDAKTILIALRADTNIEEAELNSRVNALETSNEPLLDKIWSFQNTGQDYYHCSSGTQEFLQGTPDADSSIVSAWNTILPTENVVVAVVDTGIDLAHPDIADNIWTNENEIPNNGIDDDKNGYIDDVNGYNFVANNNNPTDDFGHGTHCAGTIGATNNNMIGVAGISPTAKLMAVKFLDENGSGYLSTAVDSIIYAADNGAQVISNSWGGGPYSQTLVDAINYATNLGAIVVAAAGNSGDSSIMYPAAYDNVISVAATDSNDEIAYFSTYNDYVDLSAPGVDILSLHAANTDMYGDNCHTVDSDYYFASGTSMACPHVAGALAYLKGVFPSDNNSAIISRLIYTTKTINDSNPERVGKTGTGRMDLNSALITDPHPVFKMKDYELTDFEGNNNGIPESGEKIKLRFKISNDWLIANNVQLIAKLNETNQYLTLLDPKESKSFFENVNSKPFSTTGTENNDQALTTILSKGSKLYEVKIDWPQNLDNNSQLNGPYWVYSSVNLQFTASDLLEPEKMPIPTGTRSFTFSDFNNNEITYYRVLNYELTTLPGENSLGTIEPNSYAWSSGIYLGIDSTTPPNTKVTINLTLSTEYGYEQTIPFSFIINPTVTMKPNWPIPIGSQVWSSPNIGNLKGGNQLNIVVGTDDGYLYVLNANGSVLDGWPVQVGTKSLRACPAIGDLNNDGSMEIVVAAANTTDTILAVFNADGTFFPGWPQHIQGKYFESNSAIIGDINGDGNKEIVFATGGQASGLDNPMLYAFESDGTLVNGFPVTTPTNVLGFMSTPAIADLDGDGTKEIIIGSSDTYLYAWHYDGTAVNGFPVKTYNSIWSSVAIGDIDGDGLPEIVFDTNFGLIYAINNDGSLLPNFPFYSGATSSEIFASSSPALYDVDGDGLLDIIIGQTDGKIYSYNYLGESFPGFPIDTGEYLISSVVLADIDNDGETEIIVGGTDGDLFAYNLDGTEVMDGDNDSDTVGVLRKGAYMYSTALLGNPDQDGSNDITIGGADGSLYMWVFNATPNPKTNDWPKFHRDQENHGVIN